MRIFQNNYYLHLSDSAENNPKTLDIRDGFVGRSLKHRLEAKSKAGNH